MHRMRKTWRCFHCDEVFRSRKAALAHELRRRHFSRYPRELRMMRMALDAAEDELLTARMALEAVREKAPDVYAEVVQ